MQFYIVVEFNSILVKQVMFVFDYKVVIQVFMEFGKYLGSSGIRNFSDNFSDFKVQVVVNQKVFVILI